MSQNYMPREEGMDHTVSLIREGYLYIPNRLHSFHSDLFETRLFGKKAICMGGREAAEVFYDNDKFKRKGAVPKRVIKSLFGEKGVHTLDGEAHQFRKNLFMSVMSSDGLKKLTEITKRQWEKAVDRWEPMEKVILYEEVKELLCWTACERTGVPFQEDQVKKHTKE